MRNHKG
jgi:hypothetical protein